MFDLPYPSHSNYNNRFIFLSLIGSIVVLCILGTLILKCVFLAWAKLCKRQGRKRPSSAGGRQVEDSNMNLANVLVVQDTYVNPYCQNGTHGSGIGEGQGCGPAGEAPYSVFQFSTDDISLAFSVQAVKPARRPDITKAVFEEIVVEALKQRKRQLNPMAKPGTLNKRPKEAEIFAVQMQLLDPSKLTESVLERKYSFFSNILRVQGIVERVWEMLDEREPLWLNVDERWVCRLVLEVNQRIDNTVAECQMNPDMMCALAFVDAPLFLTQRSATRRGCSSHHALCAHGCGGGQRRSSTRSARSAYTRFVREMEPPPKFDSVVGVDGEDEVPPPSYDDACMGVGDEGLEGLYMDMDLDGKTAATGAKIDKAGYDNENGAVQVQTITT